LLIVSSLVKAVSIRGLRLGRRPIRLVLRRPL
jgi:hypothetical protein